MTERWLEGRCLCGTIGVRLRRPGALVFCHCRECRRAAGAPFQAVVPVAADDFELDDPAGALREYRASPHKVRAFCGRCGAPVFSRRDGVDRVRVRAGLLDDVGEGGRAGHIFVADAAPWDRVTDTLPRYDRLEPARAAAGAERPR